MSALLRSAGIAALALGVSACSTLSGSGPSAATLRAAPAIEIVPVTLELAASAESEATRARQAALDTALGRLASAPEQLPFRFAAGDTIEVTMWSYAPLPGANSFAGNGPGASQLGSFTLDTDGAVLLPYAGRVALAGQSLAEAQQTIAARYAALKILQGPTATVKVASSPHSDVLVTGAVGHPTQVAWSPAGLTLAQAITQALGDGASTLGQGDLSATRAAVRVSVARGDGSPVEVPIAAAFERPIPLRPGDRVVVRKAPVVEVTMLGGGTRKNGVLGFAKQPALAEALADANGLDGNTANDHAVYVMRRRVGAKPILFEFAWKRGDGLVAAQQFPLEDGDVVYVAEAPIVSIQKVVGLLFQVTLPAQVLK
jgi:polysaccharide biosynthesis/export protein